jgi:hypothetical protein
MTSSIQVIAKNDSTADIFLTDLGIKISGLSEVVLSDQFEFAEISGGDSLKVYVGNGQIIINDGTQDLTDPQAGLFHIKERLEASDVEEVIGWHEDTVFTSCIDFSVFIDINGNVMRSIL